jgi:hypothetical protein
MKSPVEVSNATFRQIKTVRGTAPAVAEVVLALRRARTEIAADGDVSDQRRQELIRAAHDAASESLAAIRAGVQAAEKEAAEALRQARAPKLEGADAVAREMRVSRAWDRMRAEIDRGVAPEALAERAAANGDRDSMDALREALPSIADGERLQALDAVIRDISKGISTDVDVRADEVERELSDLSYFASMSLAEAEGEIGSLDGRHQALILPVTKTDLIDLRTAV